MFEDADEIAQYVLFLVDSAHLRQFGRCDSL